MQSGTFNPNPGKKKKIKATGRQEIFWPLPGGDCDPCVPRKVIQASMRSKERAAILCTQSLEEAAAMCDRVAILVSGQLRWALGDGGLLWGVVGLSLGFLFLNLMENTGLDVFVLVLCVLKSVL